MQPTMVLLRFFHVLSGVMWVGGVGVVSMFLVPAVQGAGPGGAAVMRYLLVQTKFGTYFPVLGGLTVLSGILMYWHNGSISQSAFYASPMGITYGIGGLFGLTGVIFGGAVVGRAAGELGKILKTIDPSTPPTPEQGARMTALRNKITWGSKIVLPVLILAVVCMAVARYV